MIPFAHLFEKRYSLHGKVHVILLHARGVEGENVKGLDLAEGGSCGDSKSSHEGESAHVPNHRCTFLAEEDIFLRLETGLCYV
jgi:hypothetical protein